MTLILRHLAANGNFLQTEASYGKMNSMYEPSWYLMLRHPEYSTMVVDNAFDELPVSDRKLLQTEINRIANVPARNIGKRTAKDMLSAIGMFMVLNNLDPQDIENIVNAGSATGPAAKPKRVAIEIDIDEEDLPIWNEKGWRDPSW
jgi:hypothetical protein